MKFEFFIAGKYLTRNRKNSFISIISLVSIVGITIGVAALVIALSLINGFQNDIKSKILSSTAHIMINDRLGEGIEDFQELTRKLTANHSLIESANPVVFGTVLLKGHFKNSTGTMLRGIIPGRNSFWSGKIRTGKFPEGKNELMIGEEISAKMGLYPGDSCFLITAQFTMSPTGLIPRIRKFKVSGIFKTGLYEFDNGTILTSLKTAQKLFKLKDKVSYLQIYLNQVSQVDNVAEKMQETLPSHLSIITWKELNASLYSALKLEKTMLFFTLTLIIVVASLNIIAGLILMVIQKIKDIGILLSCGATPKIIKRIFFIQGGIVGLLGTFFGVLIGLLFCLIANKVELIKVPFEIYQMNYVPFNTNMFDLSLVIFTSLLISFTATIIPSKKASSVNVVNAVKNE